jgi:hypothetical protein
MRTMPTSQQQQQTESRALLGNDSVSVALAHLQHIQQAQQMLGLSSLQQQGYQSDMYTRIHALHQQMGHNSLTQAQQYQLLLEQHAQQQRERFRMEQQSLLSQVAHHTQQHPATDVSTSNRAQLLRQTGDLYERSRVPAVQRPDWMNFREQPAITSIPSSTSDIYHQLRQQQLLLTPVQSILPGLNLGGPTDLRHILATSQRMERNPFASMVSGSMELGQHLLGRASIPTDLGRNIYPFRQQNEGYSIGIPPSLPITLSKAEDAAKLSPYQVLLRMQIEAFQATDDDVTTHTRGRNKPVVLGQVGIRCRHCAHLPVSSRQKGSTYFPATVLGIYQAAQNMSTSHIQGGVCSEMPIDLKRQFETLQNLKVASSGAGRPYWAESARILGLVDTEDGIQFIRSLRPGVRVLADNESKTEKSK